MPDGKSIVVVGNDSERVSQWQAAIAGGDPQKPDTRDVSPIEWFHALRDNGVMAERLDYSRGSKVALPDPTTR